MVLYEGGYHTMSKGPYKTGIWVCILVHGTVCKMYKCIGSDTGTQVGVLVLQHFNSMMLYLDLPTQSAVLSSARNPVAQAQLTTPFKDEQFLFCPGHGFPI